jgi:hydrogenase nickel incorporation protein HypA/HybF
MQGVNIYEPTRQYMLIVKRVFGGFNENILKPGEIEKEFQKIHELAVTESVLKIVLKYAEDNQAVRVVSISLQAGELRDLTEEWIQRYFDYLSHGTIAEGARIGLKRIPIEMKCAECARSFGADLQQEEILCPGCGSPKSSLAAGNEFLIESIGVI